MSDPDGPRTEWMNAAADVLRGLNADEEPAALLRRVARHTCALTGVDSCAVMLLDETGTRLVTRASHGLTEAYRHDLDSLAPMLVHPTAHAPDVPAAQAVRERRTVVLSDVDGLGEDSPWRAAAGREGIHSILAVPLDADDGCAGVLVGYTRRAHRFAASELALAELMAQYVATVLRAARVKEVQRSTIAQLEKTNAELTTAVESLHHERAQREWAEAQDRRLVALLLDDAGLDGVLDALADALAATVVLESAEDGTVLARSADAAAGRERPAATAALPLGRELGTLGPGSSPVRLELGDAHAWVLALAVAGEAVARLWVIRDRDAGAGAPPLVRSVIERFAPLVALELHKRRHAADAALRLTRDLAVDLVSGGGRDRDLRDRARALGHDLTRPHTVVLVPAGAAATRSARAARQAFGDAALVGEDAGSLVVLVPDADRAALVAAAAALPDRPTVVGATVTGTEDYPAAWRVVRTAAALAAAGPRRAGPVVDLDDLGVAALLLESGAPDGLRRLADRTLGPLERHDAQRSTDLVGTLRAWLDAGGATAEAARALHVHPHTVGYRLRRAGELTGLDLQRADAVFELRVAMMVRAVQRAAGHP
ncbi:helix-turn-helix domain-containing protein [Pseudonocardia sp. D17]|uniref:helix-turn-helix domain-containing protein n=1 Tax=Pseudonocardia sp. D17 TaxID=882661 RepID=UPI0030CE45BB